MSELAAWTLAFCRWCNGSYVGHVIRDSAWLFPFVEVFHLLALGLLGGTLVLVNLSLLGIRFGSVSTPELARELRPWMFGSIAVMLLAAALNVIVFNLTLGRTLMQWDARARTPRAVKISGLLSLVLWVAVVACGRGIAYVLPPP